MVTHLQMFQDEEKLESEKCLLPKVDRQKMDITIDNSGVSTKRPKALFPKLSARFGVPTSHLAHKDDTEGVIQHSGEMVRKRKSENSPSPSKKPRCDGLYHSSEHGNPNSHAASSSSLL